MTAGEQTLRDQVARLRRMVAQLSAYRELSRRLQAATAMEEVAAISLATLSEVFGAPAGALLVLASPGQPDGPFSDYADPSDTWSPVPAPTRRGLLSAVLRRGKPLAEPDAASFFARQGLPAAPTLSSFLAAPCLVGGMELGALVACNLQLPGALDRYVEDAAALASPVCHAVAHVRLMEARSREARLLDAIIEHSHSQIAYLDPDFRFVRANPAYVQSCGHSLDELIGRSHFDLFPNPENQAIFARARDTGQPVQFREKPFVYPDQPERGVTYWDWRLTPLKNERGDLEGLVLSLTDMTDHVRARERLLAVERTRADLAEVLATEVDHRMKNNLATVAGLLQMALPGEAPQGPQADLVRQAIARILTVAAVHEQLYEAKSQSLDGLAAIRRIAEIGRDTLSRGDVDVSVEGLDFPCEAAVATALCASVNELITNAIKHGAPGPDGRLRIEVRTRPSNGGIEISIWNSGNPVPPGLSPETVSTVGLRMVHDIIARHYQGSFELRPERGGTLARIVLDRDRLRSGG